eukprot:18087-Heterococcus_DN1.PRE.2
MLTRLAPRSLKVHMPSEPHSGAEVRAAHRTYYKSYLQVQAAKKQQQQQAGSSNLHTLCNTCSNAEISVVVSESVDRIAIKLCLLAFAVNARRCKSFSCSLRPLCTAVPAIMTSETRTDSIVIVAAPACSCELMWTLAY